MFLNKISNRSIEDKIILQWSDIKYSIFFKDKRKSSILHTTYSEKFILKGLCGEAETGQILAIMGPTVCSYLVFVMVIWYQQTMTQGCGKTSLVNILAARVPTAASQYANLRGNITVNGDIRDEEKFRRLSAYVLQVI